MTDSDSSESVKSDPPSWFQSDGKSITCISDAAQSKRKDRKSGFCCCKYEICDNATSAHFSDEQGSSDSEGDGVSNYDTTKDTLKLSLSKHKNHHRRKYCPVWGCHAGPQLHLIWYIKWEHGHIPRARRLQMIKNMQILEKRVTSKSQSENTPMNETLFARQARKQSSQPLTVKAGKQQEKSTHNFRSLPKDHPEMTKVSNFLRTLDRERKKERI